MSLISSVGNNLKNLPSDVLKVKRVLEFMDILDPGEDSAPKAGIMTGRVRDGIKILQRDHGLDPSGDILEGSDTAKKVNEVYFKSASGEVYGPPAPPKAIRAAPVQGKPILNGVPDKEAKDFIQGNEGTKQHFYKDSKGNITVGTGYLVPDAATAKNLPFYMYQNNEKIRKAKPEEIGSAYS